MANPNALFTLNGEIVEASKAQGSFLCPPFMFGYGVLDRLRFFWTPRGLICPGLRLHLVRTLETVHLLFPGAEAPSSARLVEWMVAECGCANAFALDCNGNLHLPARGVVFFNGTKVRLVEALHRAYFPGKAVLRDLRRSHLRFNGGAVGTATKVLVPIAELDHEPTDRTGQFGELAGRYEALCRGELDRRDLQEDLAPVVLTTQGQRVAIA